MGDETYWEKLERKAREIEADNPHGASMLRESAQIKKAAAQREESAKQQLAKEKDKEKAEDRRLLVKALAPLLNLPQGASSSLGRPPKTMEAVLAELKLLPRLEVEDLSERRGAKRYDVDRETFAAAKRRRLAGK